jgi:hypothetical protein
MPLLPTADEWLQQSSLLLKARPTSVMSPLSNKSIAHESQTRITTKYNIPDPSKAKSRKRKTRDDEAEAPTEPLPSIATLTLKTYDPDSGACLKYKTNKGWEVGRLIANLGRLGRHMAALPEIVEGMLIYKSMKIDKGANMRVDTAMLDVAKKEDEPGSGTHTPIPESTKSPAADVKAGQGGGGGKKKKKGKR